LLEKLVTIPSAARPWPGPPGRDRDRPHQATEGVELLQDDRRVTPNEPSTEALLNT
jgi:hypothetical protein